MNIHSIYGIFQNYFRPRRMRMFARMFGVSDQTRIIDLGGTDTNWYYLDKKPDVLIANFYFDDEDVGNLSYRKLDATDLPFEDFSFDVTYSNSVIEHVGDWEKQKAFAREASRMSENYYIQTPNRWFFVEPHFLCPFIHFLPRDLYRKLLPYFSIWYWMTRPSEAELQDMFDEIKLLTKSDMQKLFPDAEIIEEKFLYVFTKSFIAVRRKQPSVQLSKPAIELAAKANA